LILLSSIIHVPILDDPTNHKVQRRISIKINKIVLAADADTRMFARAQKMVQLVKDVDPSYDKIVIKKFVNNSQHGGNSWTEEVTQVFSKNVKEERDRVLKCSVLEVRHDGDITENVMELAWLTK
jgi:hypothetical protein